VGVLAGKEGGERSGDKIAEPSYGLSDLNKNKTDAPGIG
jgi:hypothetical protein